MRRHGLRRCTTSVLRGLSLKNLMYRTGPMYSGCAKGTRRCAHCQGQGRDGFDSPDLHGSGEGLGAVPPTADGQGRCAKVDRDASGSWLGGVGVQGDSGVVGRQRDTGEGLPLGLAILEKKTDPDGCHSLLACL